MRLENMTPAHVRRAVEIYTARAWPKDADKVPTLTAKDLEGAATMEALLERFLRVDACEEQDGFRRYTLRLGNQRYPFMKFVIQEYLVDAEFFFSVDTHDNLEIRPGTPDYEEWLRIKEFNRLLKDKIEFDWREAQLPTLDELRLLCEGLAPVEREGQKRARLLVVDDEKSVAMGLRALLAARGYEVDLAYTGEEVLERVAQDPLPDLILLDFELPELDGEEVLDRLRADPRTADMPVLMATASSIELDRLGKVNGLLHKPYPRAVLFKMIRKLLGLPKQAT
jgi:CheY-like chemotaxis protein